MSVATDRIEPTTTRRVSHRRISAATMMIGGALTVAGVFLPWVRVFAGLESFSGSRGLYGEALLTAAAVAIGIGIVRFSFNVELRGASVLAGSVLVSIAGFVAYQAIAGVRSFDPMLLPTTGPGPFVALAGGVVVLGGALWGSATSELDVPIDRIAWRILALLSGGAGAIHLAASPDHLGEWKPLGVAFIVAGLLQLLWAVSVVEQPSRILLVVGAAGNVVFIAAWAVSRTSGFPIGPDAGVPEAVGLADVITIALEIALVALALVCALRPMVGRLRSRVANVVFGVIASAVIVASVIAVASVTGALGAGGGGMQMH
jgi:hypothetical protein